MSSRQAEAYIAGLARGMDQPEVIDLVEPHAKRYDMAVLDYINLSHADAPSSLLSRAGNVLIEAAEVYGAVLRASRR